MRFQSTHPRGVRPSTAYVEIIKIYFNPRTHVGCDSRSKNISWLVVIFQSTHPRGVRQSCCEKYTDTLYFNPRTHVGCDKVVVKNILIPCISIHAPTWGATETVAAVTKIEICISIHAPTWGATVKPSNGWLLGHKDNEFANENIIIINSVNIT